MPLIAPPPKPGRTRVYRVTAEFRPKEADQMELASEEIVFLREAKADEKCCEVKCGQKSPARIGLFPKELIAEHLELIEFPLQEAAKMGDWEFLRECLENKVSVNSLDKSGSTALHWAAYTGHAEIVENLLTIANVDISAQNKLGDTPLHAASAKGRLDCVQLLVEAGANVHAKNGQAKKPLDVAASPEIGAILRTTMAKRGDPREEEYLDGDGEEEEDDGEGSQG